MIGSSNGEGFVGLEKFTPRFDSELVGVPRDGFPRSRLSGTAGGEKAPVWTGRPTEGLNELRSGTGGA